MREVSCRAFGFFELVAERLALDLDELLEGTGLSRAEVSDPSNRADWNKWVDLCDRLEDFAGGPASAERWGRVALEMPVARRLLAVTSHFVSADHVYEAIVRWFGPFLFRNLDFEIEQLAEGALRLPARVSGVCVLVSDGERSTRRMPRVYRSF